MPLLRGRSDHPAPDGGWVGTAYPRPDYRGVVTLSPHAPGPAHHPTGTIRLTIQGSLWTTNVVVPTCTINGYLVPTRYGPQDLVVWAGRTTIALQAQWLRTYGQASLDVDVAPGQVVDVFYAAPWHQFTTGSIGTTPQSRKGAGFLVGCVAVPLGLATLAVLLGAVFSALS